MPQLLIRGTRMLAARAISTHTADEWNRLLSIYLWACVKCGAASITKDHVQPVSNGGHDGLDNLQPLCVSCNASKYTTTADHRPTARMAWTRQRIRGLRVSLGENAATFGARFGRSGRSIEDWEQGRRRPDVLALMAIDAIAHPVPRAIDRRECGHYSIIGHGFRVSLRSFPSAPGQQISVEITIPTRHVSALLPALEAACADETETNFGHLVIQSGPHAGLRGAFHLTSGATWDETSAEIAGHVVRDDSSEARAAGAAAVNARLSPQARSESASVASRARWDRAKTG